MVKWEMTQVRLWNHKEIEEHLAVDWEPFAIIPEVGDNYGYVYFRRLAAPSNAVVECKHTSNIKTPEGKTQCGECGVIHAQDGRAGCSNQDVSPGSTWHKQASTQDVSAAQNVAMTDTRLKYLAEQNAQTQNGCAHEWKLSDADRGGKFCGKCGIDKATSQWRGDAQQAPSSNGCWCSACTCKASKP